MKCKLKQRDTTMHSSCRMAKIQNTDKTKCWQGYGEQELSYISGGNAKWYSRFGRQFGSFLQTKYSLALWSNNHAPWHLPKWFENICPHKTLHMNVYSRFIYYCQNLVASEMSLTRWMDKQTIMHPNCGILYSNKKKQDVKQ